eukprot:UC1_evm5s1656
MYKRHEYKRAERDRGLVAAFQQLPAPPPGLTATYESPEAIALLAKRHEEEIVGDVREYLPAAVRRKDKPTLQALDTTGTATVVDCALVTHTNHSRLSARDRSELRYRAENAAIVRAGLIAAAADALVLHDNINVASATVTAATAAVASAAAGRLPRQVLTSSSSSSLSTASATAAVVRPLPAKVKACTNNCQRKLPSFTVATEEQQGSTTTATTTSFTVATAAAAATGSEFPAPAAPLFLPRGSNDTPLVIEWEAVPEGLDPSTGDLDAGRSLRKRQQLESAVAHAMRLVKETQKSCNRAHYHCVDFGAGSGHLGLLMAYTQKKCRVTLVERKEWSVRQMRERLERLGDVEMVSRVTVFHGSVDDFAATNQDFDLAVSMHSCGTLTDEILAQCLRWKAAFSLVPCCYGQINGTRSRALSQHYHSALDEAAYRAIVSAADYSVAAGQWAKFASCDNNFRLAKTCMRLVDQDRLAHTSEISEYTCTLASLEPLGCSPKNNVIQGAPPLAAMQ